MEKIPQTKVEVPDQAIQAVVRVLMSGKLAMGEQVAELQKKWEGLTAVDYALAVGSGTGAIRLALMSLGVGKEDKVILPAYSCTALFNAILALGARPLPVDVRLDDWTLDFNGVMSAGASSSRAKAVIAVHMFGLSADVSQLVDLLPENVAVIEDVSHGVGTFSGGLALPYGCVGKLNVASFYATKFIGAGEGGIVGTNWFDSATTIAFARAYDRHKPDGLYLNDKMTEVEAVIALAQLERYVWLVNERQRIALVYSDLLMDMEQSRRLMRPVDTPGRVWYRYAVRLMGHRARAVAEVMQGMGVEADQPVWDLRHAGMFLDWARYRNTNIAFDHLLSLPFYPGMTEDDQVRVVEVLEQALSR